MFPYQVFSVITMAIIISFGVFSCHNLSLALIYSTGLFPSSAGGKEPSIRRQQAPSPAEAFPRPERSRGAPWPDHPPREGMSVPTAACGQDQTKTCHWFGAGSPKSDAFLLFQLLLAPAHVGLN